MAYFRILVSAKLFRQVELLFFAPNGLKESFNENENDI